MVPVRSIAESLEVREGGTLFWRIRPRHHFQSLRAMAIWNKKWSGKMAGYGRKDGYRVVRFKHEGRTHVLFAHRIVWALVHGSWPALVIDHINRDPADNRIENLRDVTQAENLRNRVMRSALLTIGSP